MSCCKLFLVPEEVINSWRADQRERAVDKPVHELVNQMDTDLSDILNKQGVSEYDKEKMYSQELSKYLAMRDQKREPQPPPPPPPPRQQSSDPSLTSVPKSFRSKAEALLDYLKSDKDLQWDEEGRVSIKQRQLEGSHILDLIHDAVRLRKKEGRAVGWHELSSHLRGRNVPKALVGNREWLESKFYTPPSSVRKQKAALYEKSHHKQTARKLWGEAQLQKMREDWEETASP